MSSSALAQPGPHGLPMRFQTRNAGWSGMKICGEDVKQPIHFMTVKSRKTRQILHETAHKKDKSAPLVTVQKPHYRSKYSSDKEDFKIILHPAGSNGRRTHDETIEMEHKSSRELNGKIIDFRYRPTWEFTLRVGPQGRQEVFRWIKPQGTCQELKTIYKSELSPVKTGMQRPQSGRITRIVSGYILVRMNGRGIRLGEDKKENEMRPLGYDKEGREIVASCARGGSGWIGGRKMFFQFWGSGCTGELGEDFTRVAAVTGSALWQDEILKEAEQAQRQNAQRNKQMNKRR
ncbi:hypothetical protein QBC38DRAFT_481960 [Podospora fimiseda]|uniref:Uncharacterized protein n=1 Tax=Podospora fimiseda TaxID=252190 RepID=A0AAN7H1L7_9PEZI|nr:hypothetical protein QBC38DRAFT_481960 [Podospora fimiseda]